MVTRAQFDLYNQTAAHVNDSWTITCVALSSTSHHGKYIILWRNADSWRPSVFACLRYKRWATSSVGLCMCTDATRTLAGCHYRWDNGTVPGYNDYNCLHATKPCDRLGLPPARPFSLSQNTYKSYMGTRCFKFACKLVFKVGIFKVVFKVSLVTAIWTTWAGPAQTHDLSTVGNGWNSR